MVADPIKMVGRLLQCEGAVKRGFVQHATANTANSQRVDPALELVADAIEMGDPLEAELFVQSFTC